ncbi:MAG: lysoplasmalogenase family protein [Pseudomonadota bacterium]
MQFTPAAWAFVAISVAAAVLYGVVFEAKPPSLLRAVAKTVFLAALTVAFHLAGAPNAFVIALAAAASGDFFLAFDKPWVLPIGMIAFIAMHVFYIVTMLDLITPEGAEPIWARFALTAAMLIVVLLYLVWFWREPRPGRSPLLAVLAIAGALAFGGAPFIIAATGHIDASPGSINVHPNLPFAGAVLLLAAIFIWLRRDLGAVKLAGMFYAAIIMQMAYATFWLPWSGWPAMLGAICFLVSDGVLSAELFRLKPDAPARRITGPVVWWTYAAAQLLIAFGVARLV